jgi:hypothetical protein
VDACPTERGFIENKWSDWVRSVFFGLASTEIRAFVLGPDYLGSL